MACDTDSLTDPTTGAIVSTNSATTDGISELVLEDRVDNVLLVSLESASTILKPDENAVLIFSVENATADLVALLPWGTPLEAVLSADMFDVTFENELLAYRGRLVKRLAPKPSDYIHLSAGEKKQVSVNLSQGYDTRTAGVYSVQLKSVNGYYRINGLTDDQARGQRGFKAKITTGPITFERL